MVTRKSGGGFVYRQRPEDSIKKREQQSGSTREGYIKPDVKLWTPATGRNKIRILPPTWDDAGHFGLDCYVHYQVGVDQNAYICLKRNKDIVEPEECPCCEQRAKFQMDDNQEAADALNARKRVLVYMIDRAKEHDGVVLWAMPFTVDRELAAACQDIDTGELYFIDHPKEGFDVIFTREGQGQTTKYLAPRLSRDPSPISKDKELAAEWLEWITENPIPEMVIVPDAETMLDALGTNPSGKRQDRDSKSDRLRKGRRGSRDEDEDDDEPPRRRARSRAADDDDEDEPPRRRARAAAADEDDDEPPRRRARAAADDDDEDDRPAPRSRARAKIEEDDDEDEEEAALRGKARKGRVVEDDDDEEEAPRGRRSASAGSKSRKAAVEDEDEADADEEAEERPKSRGSASKGKASRPDPEDDDSDDEPPTRPTLGKRTAGGKASGKLGGLRR